MQLKERKYIVKHIKSITLQTLLMVLAQNQSGCSDDPIDSEGIYAVGYVYDGSSGTRLQGYSLDVAIRNRTIRANVNSDGRYVVGPIPPWQDFTVSISKDGYRRVRSHNQGFSVNPQAVALTSTRAQSAKDVAAPVAQTYLYDAYLFPEQLTVQDTKLVIRAADDPQKTLSGKVLLKPVSSYVLAEDVGALSPVGDRQVWINNEDMAEQAITKDFTEGSVTIPGAELLYGTLYKISIFGVVDYAPIESSNEDEAIVPHLAAGSEQYRRVDLAPQSKEPLTLVTAPTASGCTPSKSTPSELQFVFSSPIEMVDAVAARASLDAGLEIYAPSDGVPPPTELKTIGQRGVQLSPDGSSLTIRWNPLDGLASSGDDVVCYRYKPDAVQSVLLRKPGEKNAISLSTLLKDRTGIENAAILCRGTSATLCILQPQ